MNNVKWNWPVGHHAKFYLVAKYMQFHEVLIERINHDIEAITRHKANQH